MPRERRDGCNIVCAATSYVLQHHMCCTIECVAKSYGVAATGSLFQIIGLVCTRDL